MTAYANPACTAPFPIKLSMVSESCAPDTCCPTTFTAGASQHVMYAEYEEVDACSSGLTPIDLAYLQLAGPAAKSQVGWSTQALFGMLLAGTVFGGLATFNFVTSRRAYHSVEQSAEVPSYQSTL